MKRLQYDLEERLLEFAVAVIAIVESMRRTQAGAHVADQLLRAGTSPYGHHGEAEGAESRADFVHKLRVCYKELRESRRWLRLTERAALSRRPETLPNLIAEAEALVRIFAASIRTTLRNASGGATPTHLSVKS